jgi:hypothetical protein
MGSKKPEHPKEPAMDENWGPFRFSLNGHSLSGESSTNPKKVSRIFLNFHFLIFLRESHNLHQRWRLEKPVNQSKRIEMGAT